MVFYRKYRPQTIDELDNARVRETLLAALSGDVVPHAFLFTGPKGLGKTSAARIVAKIANCIRREQLTGHNSQLTKSDKGKKLNVKGELSTVNEIEPCNKCEQCISITNGSNVDILEIDAASNRGIDEIRDLKEKIRLTPVAANKKVYIIDEVHMLTPEAFNALLKTLEEPPSHALFILCTTELHKVPSTIISRCLHVAFTKATREELIRSLHRVIKGEKIAIDDDAILSLVSLADGGFRDGVKLLEEAASLSENTIITKQFVEEHFSLLGFDKVLRELIESFFKKDVKKGIFLIDQLTRQGVDMDFFTKQLLASLHEMLLVKAEVIGIPGQQFTPPNSSASLQEIQALLSFLVMKLQEYRNVSVPQLPMELAFIEWGIRSGDGDFLSGGKDINKIDTENPTVSSLRRQVGNMQKNKALYGDPPPKDEKEKKDGTEVHPRSNLSILDYSAGGEKTKEWLHEFWEVFIQKIKPENHSIAGVLRGCSIKKFSSKMLVIQTPYAFHKEKLETAKAKLLLENACQELTGKTITVSVELKGK